MNSHRNKVLSVAHGQRIKSLFDLMIEDPEITQAELVEQAARHGINLSRHTILIAHGSFRNVARHLQSRGLLREGADFA